MTEPANHTAQTEQELNEEFQRNFQEGIYNAAVLDNISQMEVNVRVSAEGENTTRKVRIIFLPELNPADHIDGTNIQIKPRILGG